MEVRSLNSPETLCLEEDAFRLWSPVLAEQNVRDYLVEWLFCIYLILLFFMQTVSFIYRAFSEEQGKEFVLEDDIY